MDLLVVEALPQAVLAWLEERHALHYAPQWAQDAAALRLGLRHARAAVLPASVPVNARLLRVAPGLLAVGRVWGGVEQIDAEACERVGVRVLRPQAAMAQAEAEFALAAMLQMLRRLPVTDADGALVGRELRGLTVGVVGITPTVTPLAAMVRQFGAEVVGYDPALRVDDPGWADAGVQPMALADVFAAADALCVMLPGFTRYTGLLGERFLQHCRRDQVLLSLSDAAILDESALASGLRRRAPLAVWLDCAPPGLMDSGRPLFSVAAQVQITPRLASTTRESRLRSAWEVAHQIDALLRAADAQGVPRPADLLDLPGNGAAAGIEGASMRAPDARTFVRVAGEVDEAGAAEDAGLQAPDAAQGGAGADAREGTEAREGADGAADEAATVALKPASKASRAGA